MGRRITVSSRSFWQEFGNPFVTVRREALNAARALARASRELSQQETTGTVADLFTGQIPQGLPQDAGPFNTGAARVYVRVPFETVEQGPTGPEIKVTFKSISVSVPWDLPIGSLYATVGNRADRLARRYGSGTANMGKAVYLVY